MNVTMPDWIKTAAAADNARRRAYDVADLWADVLGGAQFGNFTDSSELREVLAERGLSTEQEDALVEYWCQNA